MKRIETANREIDKFGPGKDGFRAAVPGVSEPTYLSATFFNALQESLVRVIEAAGLVPADDHNQFLDALESISNTQIAPVKQQFERLPEAYGRVDQSMLPVLIRALAQYRLGDPTQQPLRFGIFGSSLGNAPTLPDPATQAPGIDFFTRLMKALDPGGIFAYEVRNYSLDGSTVTNWNSPGGPIDAMVASGFIPHCVYLIPGMNDFATAQYNSGQGFNGFKKTFPEILLRLKQSIGCDVVVTTSAHPSVVNYPSLNSLQPGIPQVYPTAIPSPVSDDQLQPPASQGNVTTDFFGEGVEITVSRRYLSGNIAVRFFAYAHGCPVIDAERGWLRTLQEWKVSTGSMSAAERGLFNPGQINHPNIFGIGGSYHGGNARFAEQIGRQAMQSSSSLALNGCFVFNRPSNAGLLTGDPVDAAVVDVSPAHGDVTTSPFVIRTNTGPLDGYGSKSPEKAWRADPLNGNLVSATCVVGSKLGMPAIRAMDYTGRLEVRDRLRFYNLPSGSTLATYTLPEGMSGSFTLAAFQPGVPISQRYRIEFSTHNGVITLEPGSPVQIAPDSEFSVVVNGLTITPAIKYDGTTIHLACDAW